MRVRTGTRGQLSASLLDLSQTGAHVRCNRPLRRGQDAMLWWLGFEAFGKVVWASENEGGLQFYDPLPQAMLIKTREEVDLGRVPTPDEVANGHARDWYFGHR